MRSLSPDGFAERFKGCSRALWGIAAAIVGDADQAEDVLQEAALIALNKLDGFDPDTAFVAWMGQIVRNVALNHVRRRARRRAVALSPDHPGRPVFGQGNGAMPIDGRGEIAPDQRSFDDRVLEALQSLDETARACLLLRVVLDLPYREISLALGIRPGTAMSHVCRARRALGVQLAADRAAVPLPSGAAHD
jgi:RNA polymerase sigma-70 factor (ECF subfamily)